jgi:hypothetical protein
MKNENIDKNKAFEITSICRADLDGQGIASDMLDDADMKLLASKMADAYLDTGGYWESAEIIANDIIADNIPF